jgi:phosphoenolpyruvate synthase/pyruvate phosphate dikinase
VAFVVTLRDSAGAGTVGGKAASLGELARAGAGVPPGFAVTTEAFAAAMAAVDADGALRAGIEALSAADLAEVARVAGRFRALVAGAPLPAEIAAAIEAGYAGLASAREEGALGGTPDVAVRSSATVEDSAEASFAGLQDTYLGVSGPASVLDHVRRCWASMYNDESVAYRRRLGLPEAGVAMAVVVQRMVAPRAAGVMFTRSPVSGDRSVVAIEGTWGLGSALVSGDVTPDAWVISKVTGEITARRVSPKLKIHGYVPTGGTGGTGGTAGTGGAGGAGERAGVMGRVTVSDTPAGMREAPCLTDEEIRALAAVARRVEAHYGTPQDIEWAVLDAPFAQADADSPAQGSPGAGGSGTGGSGTGGSGAGGPGPEGPDASAESRVVLLQSRPETVWSARDSKPAGAPKARAADHVLTLFGKPL